MWHSFPKSHVNKPRVGLPRDLHGVLPRYGQTYRLCKLSIKDIINQNYNIWYSYKCHAQIGLAPSYRIDFVQCKNMKFAYFGKRCHMSPVYTPVSIFIYLNCSEFLRTVSQDHYALPTDTLDECA